MWSETIRYSRLLLAAFAFELDQKALAQIARTDAGRMKALDEREHVLEIFLRNAGVHRHLLRRGLEEAVVVDVADDQLGRLAILGIESGLVQLADKMLLQGLLGRDGIEKELPLFVLFLRATAVAARLRHVIAPFVVELRQLIEFLLEIVFRRLASDPALPRAVGSASSSSTGLVSISCCTRLRSSRSGAWRMSRLCCSCGARTCCRERFCD